jgi:hypothetical protein
MRRLAFAGKPGTGGRRARPGEVLGSGTRLRFVLLLFLVATSTVSMIPGHVVLRYVLGDPNNDVLGCYAAAGFDPGGAMWGNFTALAGRNAAALEACIAPYATPWWATPVVLAVVFALAGALCWVTPWTRIRRRSPQRIGDDSPAGTELRELARDVGLTGTRFLADRASTSTNAVAFGRPGRAWISRRTRPGSDGTPSRSAVPPSRPARRCR